MCSSDLFPSHDTNIATDIRIDPIFGVNVDSTRDTDQLLVNSYIGCYVARNLSRDGVPY